MNMSRHYLNGFLKRVFSYFIYLKHNRTASHPNTEFKQNSHFPKNVQVFLLHKRSSIMDFDLFRDGGNCSRYSTDPYVNGGLTVSILIVFRQDTTGV